MTTDGPVYRFGDFQMDTASRELRRADLVVPLDPPAYDTLLALVERAGSRLDTHALAAAVSPGGFVGDDDVSRSLNRVRKALGEMPDGRFYIETDPRRGCRFVADVELLR